MRNNQLPYVPYRPAPHHTARDMVARSMTSTGRRALGTLPTTYFMRRNLSGLGAATVVGGASRGAATGASVGSAVPIVGTAVGAILGAVGGAIAGVLSKQDQEVANFDQAVALWTANRLAVLNIADKYLVLAGLFDLSLKNPHIPIYQKYGRMGEQRFVTDMMNVIYQAGQQGRITVNDTPQTIMSNIVQPWIDSFGFGQMIDPHADLINLILLGMVVDYISNNQTSWLARGGDWPFANLPRFTLPAMAVAAQQQQPVQTGFFPTPPPIIPSLQPLPPPQQVLPAPAVQLPLNTIVQPIVQPPAPVPLPASPVIQQPPLITGPVSATGPTMQPQFPSGFTAVGTDANGNPVYANAQGVLYQWTGSAMQSFTGSLASNASISSQIQSALQQALASGQSQAQATATAMQAAQSAGVAVTPALQQQVSSQAAVTATAPAVQTAGVGLSGSTGLLAVGAVILTMMFATARPAKATSHG